jgi:hypothetical protein
MWQGCDIGKAEPDEIRKAQRAGFGNMAESAPAAVVVVGRVGQRANTNAVEYNPDDAVKTSHERFLLMDQSEL